MAAVVPLSRIIISFSFLEVSMKAERGGEQTGLILVFST